LGRLSWQIAEVVEVVEETPRVKSLALQIPDWIGHRAGQHLDVRLTAEDGYQAQRSYSIGSAPEEDRVMITVERLDDGEVSPYLADVLVPGDQVEVRGPIGGFFIWESKLGGPVLLVAGGSGVVPLMAMVRHAAITGADANVRMLFSSRAFDDVIYRDELDRLGKNNGKIEIFQTLTRSHPEGWKGYSRRVDREMLGEVAWPASQDPQTFICGPTSFVEGVSSLLVEMGYPAQRVKTERFGPTGA
jgi:ferredoxin-NADP reductase